MMNRLMLLLALLPALAAAAPLSVQVLDGSGKAVEDAVLYAETPGQKYPAHGTGRMVVDQVNKEFVPYVSVVQSGTAISFPNKDNIRHHVYSFSPAKSFDIKLYSGTPSSPVLFDKPGLVVLGCNIHDWMLAYVLVVNTPWYARSDDKGQARIADLPAGNYRLRVWHPRMAAELELPLKMGDAAQSQSVRVTLGKPDARSKW